jgi:hypothetical protein
MTDADKPALPPKNASRAAGTKSRLESPRNTAAAAPRRPSASAGTSGQDHALELHPSAGGGVSAPVIHPRADELHLAGPGGDGARWGVPVAHHQPVAVLIDQLGVGRDVALHLGLQRDRQHPPGTFAKQLVQVQGQLDPRLVVNHYTQHRGVPSSPALARRRPPYRSGWKVRRALMPGAHPQVPTIAPRGARPAVQRLTPRLGVVACHGGRDRTPHRSPDSCPRPIARSPVRPAGHR